MLVWKLGKQIWTYNLFPVSNDYKAVTSTCQYFSKTEGQGSQVAKKTVK